METNTCYICTEADSSRKTYTSLRLFQNDCWRLTVQLLKEVSDFPVKSDAFAFQLRVSAIGTSGTYPSRSYASWAEPVPKNRDDHTSEAPKVS